MLQIMVESLGVLVVFMILFFLTAAGLKDNSIVDIAWGLGYVLVAALTFYRFSSGTYAHMLMTFLVSLWGLRLAVYIFFRNKCKGEDFRYKALREKWGNRYLIKSFFFIFIFQGVLLFIIALPIMVVNGSDGPVLSIPHLVGMILFCIGFLFEVVADIQLARFKRNSSNKGKLMTKGLWSLSRHPNYFGESVVWWGIYWFALPVNGGWMTIISPLLITYLLIFFSGVPLLEKKYADREDFKAYKQKTPIFIPFIPWY
jgi:steroid 5-alpha reductase family enzyme